MLELNTAKHVTQEKWHAMYLRARAFAVNTFGLVKLTYSITPAHLLTTHLWTRHVTHLKLSRYPLGELVRHGGG